MALYDAPVARGYEILTHIDAGRKYARNGYAQVGNTTLPTNPISARRVTPSAIYNKGIAGLSEAGYGRRYPYPRGLSSALYRPGRPPMRRALRDAYINDNPPPGSLRGLADDIATTTQVDQNLPEPTVADLAMAQSAQGGFWSALGADLSAVTTRIVQSSLLTAGSAATGAIQSALTPTQRATQAFTTTAKAVLPTSIMGISTTVFLLAAGIGAYLYLRK